MKKNGLSILPAVLLLIWLIGPATVYAQHSNILQAEVSLMDDYGEVLQDYVTRDFKVENGQFIYRDAPQVDDYVFATANVLKLETEQGTTYRVHYFYTLDETEPAPLPEPVPIDEMPMKRAPLEKRSVWVSWTNQDMEEVRPSGEQTWDFFWETYDIPSPEKISGYAFQRLETGRLKKNGGDLPHFVFIYRTDRSAKTAPSLLFEHRIKDRVLTLKGTETTSPEPMPGTSSSPQTTSASTREPVTSAPPLTQPATQGQSITPKTAPVRGEAPSEPVEGFPGSVLVIAGIAVAVALAYKMLKK